MKKADRRKRVLIIVAAILVIISGSFAAYKYQKTKLFDNAVFTSLYKNLDEVCEEFNSQEDLRLFITDWADSNHLKYSVDKSNNIIFTQKAVNRKKNVSPTVVIVNYNYENASSNKKVLSSAAMVALTKLNSGKKTVIFINNENNDGSSYRALDQDLIPDNAKVIYLDYGKSAYVSGRSFGQQDQTLSIPLKKEPVTCDTAIKIRIGGIRSDVIDTGISKHSTPVSLLSTILTRLKTKSTICQISDIRFENRGYMYPTGAEITVILNSYSVESFTGYLDKRIEKFEKALKDDNPYCYYTYEILDESSEAYPEDAYSREAFDSLTTALYAFDNGVYRYEEDEEVPEGYDASSIYGINCLRQVNIEDDILNLDITSQAVNKKKMKELISDNKKIADLAGCEFRYADKLSGFNNDSTGMINTLKQAYFLVNDLITSNVTLESKYDTYFTPMTYICEINDKADIIHVKECSEFSSVLTNMLLVYIQTKGNFLSL